MHGICRISFILPAWYFRQMIDKYINRYRDIQMYWWYLNSKNLNWGFTYMQILLKNKYGQNYSLQLLVSRDVESDAEDCGTWESAHFTELGPSLPLFLKKWIWLKVYWFFFIFLKDRLVFSLIFSKYFLVFISSISTLIFIISFLY